MRPNFFLFATLLILRITAVEANPAAPVDLACEGTGYLYPPGEWVESKAHKHTQTVVIRIEPRNGTLFVQYLPHFGDQKLSLIVGAGHYGGELKFNRSEGGQYLNDLVVYVNRITGKAQVHTGVYEATGKEKVALYSLFEGSCAPLRPKF